MINAALMIESPSSTISIRWIGIGLYARKISTSVSTTSQTQIEMNSLLLPAKCSSACACAVISFLLPLQAGVMANVNRHDVDQREHKHPDEVDEVPVKTADLDV